MGIRGFLSLFGDNKPKGLNISDVWISIEGKLMKKEPNLEGILKRSNKYSKLDEEDQGLYKQVVDVMWDNIKPSEDHKDGKTDEKIVASRADYYITELLKYEENLGGFDNELRKDINTVVTGVATDPSKKKFKKKVKKYFQKKLNDKRDYLKHLENTLERLGKVPKVKDSIPDKYKNPDSEPNELLYTGIHIALAGINSNRDKPEDKEWIKEASERLKTKILDYEKKRKVIDLKLRRQIGDTIEKLFAPDGATIEGRLNNIDAVFDEVLYLHANPKRAKKKFEEAFNSGTVGKPSTPKEKKRKGVKVGLYSTIVAAEAAVAVWFYFNTIKPGKEHLNNAYIGAKVTFDTALYLFGLGEQADLDKEIISNAEQASLQGKLNQKQLEQVYENLEAVLPAGKSGILQKHKDNAKKHESMLQEYSKSLDAYIANCDSVKTKLKLLKKDANYLSAQLFEIIPKKILGDDGKEEKTDEKKNEKKEDKSIWEKARELGKDAVDTMRKIRDKLKDQPEGTTAKQAEEFVEKAIKGFEQHHDLNKVKTQLEALVKEYDRIEGSLNDGLGHYNNEKQNVQNQLKQLSQIEGVVIEATSSGKDATAVMKTANKIYQDINKGVYVDRSKDIEKAKTIVKERGLEKNVRELNIYKDLPAISPIEILYGAGVLAFLAVQTGLVKAATAPVRAARKAGGLVKTAVRYNPATLVLYDGTRLGKAIYRKTKGR